VQQKIGTPTEFKPGSFINFDRYCDEFNNLSCYMEGNVIAYPLWSVYDTLCNISEMLDYVNMPPNKTLHLLCSAYKNSIPDSNYESCS
jgi:hypothetical protein